MPGTRRGPRALLAVVGCALCLSASCRPGGEPEGPELPQTAAGRCAAAFFGAFDAEGDAMLRAFLEEHRSAAYLRQHPVEEGLAYFERLRGLFGKLTAKRVTLSLERQITLLVDPEKIPGALVVRFQVEEPPPHPLSLVTFSGIDRLDVPDDFANQVATRAAPVDGELRDATVRAVAAALRDRYIDPELGRRMAGVLLEHQAQGAYGDLARAGALAAKLTEDAVAVSKDVHIWVEAQNPMAQASTDPANRDLAELRRADFDFREARVVSGNIGYVKLDMIHDEQEAQEIVAAALADLEGCAALVLDLRDNIGGEWGTAALILGYLLPAGTVVSHVFDRTGTLVAERAVPRTIPGVPFDRSVPVYVLTSGETGSAAEALAYALQQMGRATVVGEVTKGAAHAAEEVILNDSFRMSVPYLRSENVRTGTDWEGVGVIPEIRVPAGEALDAATNDARKRIGS